ncbi:MAG: 6-carboxytetrahydropterin synthase QueD [Hyphomicrobiaceae bacterium]|nr:6-carboxytetrahydropterin synthase QueD [Hyphomicrobiaceae bacterium]
MSKNLHSSEVSTKKNKSPNTFITRIGRSYKFEAAHFLPCVPIGHKCKNFHGHNYRVDIVVQGSLDERGFVKDFSEMDDEISLLIEKVDHCLLNEIEGLENPTAEIIAAWFLERISDCESVRVYENDWSWAEVRIRKTDQLVGNDRKV